MSSRSKLGSLMLTMALGLSAGLVAVSAASAHGGGHSASQRSGFVNTIRPIVFHPTVNTIHPIVRTPVANTIHPIVVSPVVAATRPVLVHLPIATVGSALPPTGPIVRDHRGGSRGEGGVTITSVPRPPSSTSLCIVSCGAHLGTPTYYNAGNTIRDHRTNPGGWGN
jgi:hypothetical protein